MFDRIYAHLRTLKSISSFNRQEWRKNKLFLDAEETADRTEQAMHVTLQEAHDAIDRDLSLVKQRLDGLDAQSGKLETSEREVCVRLQRAVTLTSDHMKKQFELALSLLDEYPHALKVLEGHARAQNHEENKILIELLAESHDRVARGIANIATEVEADLLAIESDFRRLQARVASSDYAGVNDASLSTIVRRDVQLESTKFRDADMFRSHVRGAVKELENALKNTSHGDWVQESLEALGTFEKAFNDLYACLLETVRLQFHALQGELRLLMKEHHEILAVLKSVEDEQRELRGKTGALQPALENARMRLDASKRRLEQAGEATANAVAGTMKTTDGNARLNLHNAAWKRALAATLALVIVGNAAAMTPSRRHEETRQETKITAPPPDELRAAKTRLESFKSWSENEVKFVFGKNQTKIDVTKVADRIRDVTSGINPAHFDITVQVTGTSSLDHRDGRHVQNVALAHSRGERFVAELQGHVPQNVNIELLDGEEVPLDGVSHEEAKLVAQKVDVNGIDTAKLPPIEQAIYERLAQSRGVKVVVIVKEKRTATVITTQVLLPFWDPAVLPTVPTLGLDTAHLGRQVTSINRTGHGNLKETNVHARSIDLREVARNSTLAQRKRFVELLAAAHPAAMAAFSQAWPEGFRTLQRNQPHPDMRFIDASSAAIGAAIDKQERAQLMAAFERSLKVVDADVEKARKLERVGSGGGRRFNKGW
jgi:hypothetical protein